jgi:hypothetical protein
MKALHGPTKKMEAASTVDSNRVVILAHCYAAGKEASVIQKNVWECIEGSDRSCTPVTLFKPAL